MSVLARTLDPTPPGFAARSDRDRAAGASSVRVSPRATGLAVSFDAVSKSFGERSVLNALDLGIEPGQFVAIVGRSGGGKSTLLRLIAGLDRPDSGRVSIDGASVAGIHRSSRLMFQDARLLPWQRIIGNVGIARGENWREESLAALDAVGLADRAQEWPGVLSGGQRQRVALARALVARPKILLLDEPFGALDALTRIEMHQLLERLWVERGFTSVLVTHDVGEAVALADRVIVLRDGAIGLDLPIALPRPRGRDPRASALQARILAEV
jgi:sulfonate transport system ATP-binding protein